MSRLETIQQPHNGNHGYDKSSELAKSPDYMQAHILSSSINMLKKIKTDSLSQMWLLYLQMSQIHRLTFIFCTDQRNVSGNERPYHFCGRTVTFHNYIFPDIHIQASWICYYPLSNILYLPMFTLKYAVFGDIHFKTSCMWWYPP